MISLLDLWLPILLSAIGVFLASSVLHMLLKFWHIKDYNRFPNEDEVRAAVRQGSPKPGIYSLPFCSMEDFGKPETKQKFDEGPVGIMMMQPNGMQSLGKMLGLWFGFAILVSVFAAYLAVNSLAAGADAMQVFRIVGTAAFMAYGFSAIPYGIWWGQPWNTVFKDIVDGLIYASISGSLFAWLWPGIPG